MVMDEMPPERMLPPSFRPKVNWERVAEDLQSADGDWVPLTDGRYPAISGGMSSSMYTRLRSGDYDPVDDVEYEFKSAHWSGHRGQVWGRFVANKPDWQFEGEGMDE